MCRNGSQLATPTCMSTDHPNSRWYDLVAQFMELLFCTAWSTAICTPAVTPSLFGTTWKVFMPAWIVTGCERYFRARTRTAATAWSRDIPPTSTRPIFTPARKWSDSTRSYANATTVVPAKSDKNATEPITARRFAVKAFHHLVRRAMQCLYPGG